MKLTKNIKYVKLEIRLVLALTFVDSRSKDNDKVAASIPGNNFTFNLAREVFISY